MRNTLTSHPATLALAVFLLASAGLWTYSSATHAQDSAKSPRPALTVQTAPPQRTAMTQRLAANGAVAMGTPRADFGKFVQTEMAQWARVIRQAGIKLD